MSVLLLSTYDLGRQPFGLASPVAWLREAGLEVEAVDLSRDRLAPDLLARAALVAVYLPMHTATRLALPVLEAIRRRAPHARLAAYGLYAPLNEALLRAHGVEHILGPEFEADLVDLARTACGAPAAADPPGVPIAPVAPHQHHPNDLGHPPRPLPRLAFLPPDRRGLPDLSRYARLSWPDGSERLVGSTEATRGCKHTCRHCPIVPVYGGQFRVVPVTVVLEDVARQVEAGAGHITFADPDFLNGPTHARRIVEGLHARWPSLSYDVIIKVEHLRRHADLLPVLAETGCAFVTSAVESVDDRVLAHLDKGHTRADVAWVAEACRRAGLPFVPTFVAFTPWTTTEGYLDLLDTMAGLGLVEHVAPVQWTIRLLVTWQSRLLELDDIAALTGPFDPVTLTYPWQHPDPAVDALQHAVMSLVGVRAHRPRREVFARIRELAQAAAGEAAPPALPPLLSRAAIPYLNEPWYC
ncbi:MAG: CUAEP/CCAEP-tail radical SAM protein [Vicinamibacterales bacterium]|nr:CUAEP/CCAEP-tail radical SAM protein [Vicinamibacterales bacterium]